MTSGRLVIAGAAALFAGTLVVRAQPELRGPGSRVDSGGIRLQADVALAARALPSRAQATPASPAAQPIDYARDIQPIFEQYCAECHGSAKSRARLRLHSPDLVLKGGVSGPVVVPGRSDDSLIIRRVLGLDNEDRMPLEADPLPEALIARLRTWIDQGAAVPGLAAGAAAPAEHWSYVKPRRPSPPDVSRPGWPRNAIDRFVLARLDEEKLTPSPEAGRSTLLRRVSLDLTGLPPTPAELEAFLADASPGAYERVVDRLLASPRYGERWARPWLDLARYADTNGYEKDNRRSIWKYRDWVIDAFNADLPFDRFTVEQIAGDMLPRATTAQKIASGFHRNAMTNEEGGVDPDESMYEVLVDRVNTTATVWLGTTLACAQCHNHKFDPFSQKDYFRLLAFFANADYEGRAFGDGTRHFEPTLDLATDAQETARSKLQAEIEGLDRKLKTHTAALRAAQARWELGLRAAERAWTPLPATAASATHGAVLETLADGSVLASGDNPALTSYTITVETPLQGITGLRLQALPDPSLPRGGPGRDAYGHFRVTGIHADIAPLTGAAGTGGRARTEAVAPRELRFSTVKVDDSAYPVKPEDLLSPPGDSPGRKSGAWAVNAMRDADRAPRQAVLPVDAPFGYATGTRITLRIDHLDGTIGQGLGRLRLWATTAPDPLRGADLPARLRPVLGLAATARSEAQAADLAAFFRSTTPLLDPTREALSAARRKLVALEIPSTLVMRERPSFERPSYELRERGSFTARAARTFAATPAALHPMRDDQPVNRLGLARWLVDPANPLTARVAVNRLWEQLFGRGLVETSEDFGVQGTPPTHPELLDWLATEFVAGNWSQKSLLRTIVLSATYRQSSAVTTDLQERDPYNKLLARGPRFRLEAESIRDAALAASGLLSTKMHGPSVFPLQPPGIWNMPYNSDKWTTSEGEDRYRRSIYTFWRRTSPYPSFMTFDATSREYCTVRRVRTNTPLQALTLLNDPAYFEAARALAGRMTSEPPPDAPPGVRAAWGVTLVLSRAATAAEDERLVALFETEREHYRTRPDAAKQVAGDHGPAASLADRAAWTIVANVLLNLDETVTKD
ncbi:MAG TPA: PSD1 and planctomycete cytochrome C domain-containing protein [Vicinamibacterales bacterium]|nr:PSD1 and planctomycete cytochrome C domain-containing protein [Vicinamibacterales bacterium]